MVTLGHGVPTQRSPTNKVHEIHQTRAELYGERVNVVLLTCYLRAYMHYSFHGNVRRFFEGHP